VSAESICSNRGAVARARWCLLGALLLCGSTVMAQDDAARAAARDLAREGVALLKAGSYAEAQEKLHRAYQLYPMPTVALFEGEALEKLGRLVEAAERYQAARLAELPEGAHSALRRAVERGEGLRL
jgi:tetratricopeptide (TPR) repeat protein